MTEADLKFDEEIVCTKLAEEYLLVLGNQKEEKLKITHATDSFDLYYENSKSKFDISDVSTKLLALAQKIEENVQLFCQLEFLLRKIPINDTKNVDLKLITQSLVYKGSFLDADDLTTFNYNLNFTKDTPLFHLGLFAYESHTTGLTIACSSNDTVAVCTLFVELCRDVGLINVALAVCSESWDFSHPNRFDEILVGCVGVVTARSDVDSAVDDLLAATTRYSWKLSGVLVQEAAMERFTRALEWKTRDAAAGAAPFVLEPAGEARGVRVEAFRSIREALSLIEARNPLAVAAWASDGAEANEIAFGARAPLVWLNGHGHFRGPPAAAAAVYIRREPLHELLFASDSEVFAVLKMQAPWRELAPATRLKRIREVLEKFNARSALQSIAVGLSARSTVTVDRGVCIVTKTPVKCAVLTNHYIKQSFTRFLNYLVEGGAVHVMDADGDVKLLCDLLSENGVPVNLVSSKYIQSLRKNPMEIFDFYYPIYRIKAIWTSIGTIFAN